MPSHVCLSSSFGPLHLIWLLPTPVKRKPVASYLPHAALAHIPFMGTDGRALGCPRAFLKVVSPHARNTVSIRLDYHPRFRFFLRYLPHG
ncbi:hypothetical protein D9758_009901 [Tetrapyrgos nigripes]|uniref:Uncharacterized protein n=1 Tax=Tetrapyrgos nigripes TaxID=182062 RepID=A0A8H5LSG6_9AGAR|nr:hypothetical protein D9758_009901 [Tetrapyrgos nigripes]